MPKTETAKTTFGSGELSPEFSARSDTQQYSDGAKKLRNVRLLNSGAATKRPGTRWEQTLQGDSVIFEFDFSPSQTYFLVFSNTRMDAYLDDGTAAGNVTGAPWTTAQLDELRIEVSGDTVFVCHQDFWTQVIKRTGASSWTLNDLTFDTGPGSKIRQPYYKFDAADLTLTPGARTGSGVSLTASSDLFVSDHVGVRFRWGTGEFEIATVTDATNATCDIKRELPRTMELTVSSTSGFFIGEIVEGDTTGAKGEVVAIPSGKIQVTLTETLEPFTTSDTLVGPNESTAISAVSTISPVAWANWKEQMWSEVRGYPQAVALHRSRLCFGGHKSLGNALITSAAGEFFDFELGDQGDADPIFEFIGRNDNTDIQHLIAAENLLILSRKAPYYVPERSGQPFGPGNIEINLIDSVGASNPRPGILDGRVMFVDDTGKRIVALRPTGNLTASWDSGTMSLLSQHLIRNPRQAAHGCFFGTTPERYSLFVNGDDGTIAVLHAIESEEVLGWTLYETDGEVRSVAHANGTIMAVVKRTIGGSTVYLLESFDLDLGVDAAEQFSDASDTLTKYSDDTVRVISDESQYDHGDVSVDGSGNIVVDTDVDGPFEAGLFFAPTITPLPPANSASGISILTRVRRITKVNVTVQDSGRYGVDTKFTSSYRVDESFDDPPPLRSETKRFSLLGRSREPTFEITQDTAVPFTCTALSMEVVYHG